MSGPLPDTPADPVEDYLDRLLVTLSGSPRQVRHTLAEVEAHLHDAVAEGVAAGLPESQAQAQAVARMGPVHEVTGRGPALARPSLALGRRLALTAALVGSAGFLAVGAAGLVARVLLAAKGSAFLTAPWPSGSYTRADCTHWLAGDPGAHSCVTAMLADHAGDFLLQAAAAGLLGLIGLAAYLALRERWQDRATLTALPAGPGPAQATADRRRTRHSATANTTAATAAAAPRLHGSPAPMPCCTISVSAAWPRKARAASAASTVPSASAVPAGSAVSVARSCHRSRRAR